MRAFLGVALIISLMVMESNAASNELTCTICVDIVTEIGNIVIYKTKLVLEVFESAPHTNVTFL